MKERSLRTSLVLAGLLTLTVCAIGPSSAQMASQMSVDDIVAYRQRFMKLNGASWADAQAKLKAGNAEAVAVNAETMAMNAERVVGLFPQGSLTEKSKAKPEIWQRWDEFEKAAKNFQAEAEKLRDAARTKDLATTEAVAKDFGKNACGTCHQPFRVPPPRQG
jgi:cytochrome c556